MSSDGSSRNSSPAAKEPPDPPHRGDSSSSFYYSTTTTISTKSSGPSETDSDELNADKASGPSEADSESIGRAAPKTTGLEDPAAFSDASAAAMLSAFQYGPREDAAPRSAAAVSPSATNSAKPTAATTVSDPLGLLRQSDRIASAAAQSAADAAREKASRSKKKRRPDKSEEELRRERLAANRRSAAASRQRRKILIEELQNSIASLVKENSHLRRENDDLKEQLEQLREENKKLAEHLTARTDSQHVSAAPAPLDAMQDPPPPPQQDPTPNLAINLGNITNALHPNTAPNPNIQNNYLQNAHFFGSQGVPPQQAAAAAVAAGQVGAAAAFPQVNTMQQQQHTMNSQNTHASLPPVYAQLNHAQINNAQLNNAQINQALLRRYPPHVLRMLMARQQQP